MGNPSRLNRIFLFGSRQRWLTMWFTGWILIWTGIGAIAHPAPSLAYPVSPPSGLLSPQPLIAQTISNPSTVPADTQLSATAQALDPADIAAEKVDQFARAYLQVLTLLSDREPELPTATTTNEALAIERSIETDAINLIEASGLTLDEYMQLLTLASENTQFQDKVLGRMDDAADGA